MTNVIEHAHSNVVRDIDFNPNKPGQVVTGGDDRKVKIWDIRKPGKLLKVLSGHSHW